MCTHHTSKYKHFAATTEFMKLFTHKLIDNNMAQAEDNLCGEIYQSSSRVPLAEVV